MIHVDALSRNPLPVCMLSECENSIIARIRKAQHEDTHLQEIMELAETETIDDFVIRARLLFKIIDSEGRLVVPRLMHSQIIRQGACISC